MGISTHTGARRMCAQPNKIWMGNKNPHQVWLPWGPQSPAPSHNFQHPQIRSAAMSRCVLSSQYTALQSTNIATANVCKFSRSIPSTTNTRGWACAKNLSSLVKRPIKLYVMQINGELFCIFGISFLIWRKRKKYCHTKQKREEKRASRSCERMLHPLRMNVYVTRK